MSDHSVLTVIGKDRIGIVAEVATLLAEYHINILNISQQLMEDFFTMIILVDTEACSISRAEMLTILAEEGKKRALDMRLQDEALFQAMYRI
ncbi:ACT domain-containing protein [Snodgrassella sp. CFCC 13594]|uniref:ACT domain-containing protein n=1 Tax=Snodgrassella sp. CFCC 13594 TaxID=1775559 RepID=UPI00082D15BC|nr:ACT domain-containing protein [Snodgrassella sp. CFCC 13594]